MRFLMIVKASRDSEAGVLPDEKLLASMGKYNEAMLKAGVMLAGEGLQATSKGARVRFANGKTTVQDGPFPYSDELIAGYWLIQVNSKEEAVDWARRVPFDEGEIEIRQVFEAEDFPVSADEAPGGWREQEKRLREEAGRAS